MKNYKSCCLGVFFRGNADLKICLLAFS